MPYYQNKMNIQIYTNDDYRFNYLMHQENYNKKDSDYAEKLINEKGGKNEF